MGYIKIVDIKKYDSLARFSSYWYQINEIVSFNPGSILEVGVGTGFTSNYLKNLGYEVTTLDKDSERKPNIIGDVKSTSLPNDQFEMSCAFEVLEHMSYESALEALKELRRVSSHHVVISLPIASKYIKLDISFPRIKKLWTLKYQVRAPLYHGHVWELGQQGYDVKKFKDDLESLGYKIVYSYRIFANPRHYMLVLSTWKSYNN